MSTFDLIIGTQSAGQTRPQFEQNIGCPTCHQTSGRTSVGRQEFGFCVTHQCYWPLSLNPWSIPLEQEEQQRKNWERLGLENFEKVQPWFLGQGDAVTLNQKKAAGN